MTDQELRKLKRAELLQIMIAQSKKIAELQEKLEEAESKLRDKEILLKDAGNIAEASLRLNHIFEDAQKAAEQYLLNVQKQAALSFGQEAVKQAAGTDRHESKADELTEEEAKDESKKE